MRSPRRTRTVVTVDGTRVRRRPRVGDTWWDGSRWRRFDGRRWGAAAYSLRAERLRVDRPLHDSPVLGPDARSSALDRAVEDQVLTRGAVLRHRVPTRAVVGRLRPVSHVAHLLATLLTGGLWGVVWLAMCLARTEGRLLLEVDEHGHVWASRARDAQVGPARRRRRRPAEPVAAAASDA